MKTELKPENHWLTERHLKYHRGQFEQLYRSTAHLMKFVEQVLPDTHQSFKAIDVGCGAGQNMYWLSQSLPGAEWVGIDFADHLFEIGLPFFQESGKVAPEFIKGDFYHLSDTFENQKFDIVFSLQTISWLPSYEPALEQLLDITDGWLFVSSLFTDFKVDAQIQVKDYSESDNSGGPFYYNIYGYERFQEFCIIRGATEIVVEDFEIDIDLHLPTDMGLGTYTQLLANGKRQQLSGPLLMPWKLIALKVG